MRRYKQQGLQVRRLRARTGGYVDLVQRSDVQRLYRDARHAQNESRFQA
jgi:hypothetical protein